jgi:hypothetical protein
MAQAIARNHQALQRISHHHLHFFLSESRRAIKFPKREAKSASLGKPDCSVSQTRLSSFGRIETSLAEEDDCSISSSDDDDDTDDEYDE